MVVFRYSTIFLRAFFCSCPQSISLVPFLALWSGQHFSDTRGIKWFRAIILPMGDCTSLIVMGSCSVIKFFICIGCGSIPRLLTTCTRNCPDDTPNTHFAGLSLIRNVRKIAKTLVRCSMCDSFFLLLTHRSSMLTSLCSR